MLDCTYVNHCFIRISSNYAELYADTCTIPAYLKCLSCSVIVWLVNVYCSVCWIWVIFVCICSGNVFLDLMFETYSWLMCFLTMWYCSFQNVLAMVFCQWKINYRVQDVEIWRRNVECHDLTFGVQRVMQRVTRRRKRALVWKSKQNQCDNEVLNAYQLAKTRRMDRNHTDKYQVSLCLYFETYISWVHAFIDFEFELCKCATSSAKTFWKNQYDCLSCW